MNYVDLAVALLTVMEADEMPREHLKGRNSQT